MEIDLELLKKFYYVAEEKSILRAAKKLHMTQPTLSKSMSLFEYQLKMSLLQRSRRGINLTPEGISLYEHAKKLVDLNNTYINSFSRKDDAISGDLKIVTLPYLGAKWLLPRVKDFLKTYPSVHLQIHIKSDAINPITHDIGIGSYLYNQDRLIQKELFPDYTQIYASEEYLKEYGIPQNTNDLDNHRLVTYKGKSSYSEHRSINMLMYAGKKADEALRKPYLEIDSLDGMINAVIIGYGIAELPIFAAKQYPQLKQILPKIKGKNLPIYFSYQESKKNSRLIQEFYISLCKNIDLDEI